MTTTKQDARSHNHSSQRERELVATVTALGGAEVRLPTSGDPAVALLREPLQLRLPRYRQVRRRLCSSSRRQPRLAAAGPQPCPPGRHRAPAHTPAVDDGQLRGRGAGLLRVDVGARHERERPHRRRP